MGQPTASVNPLSAESLSEVMAASLPKDASPQLKNPYDALALATHAGMIAVGFKLKGLGEDHQIEAKSEARDTEPLPEEWNASSSYAFRYSHPQSSLEYLLKVNRLGSKAIVLGLGVGDEKTAQFEVLARDFISESSLPATPVTESSSGQQSKKSIQDIFISPARLADLASLLKVSIIQKLAPGIHKEGYEESLADSSSRSSQPQQSQGREQQQQQPRYDPLREPQQPPARPHPLHDPLAAYPRQGNRPLPEPIPGFEDEHEINTPPHGWGGAARRPLNIGEQDLYPQGLGPHDPFRPTLGPFGGGMPRPGGGGMHPTFDDPLFGGGGGQGGGYNPQVPPGARYDPLGPGMGGMGGMGGMEGRGPRFPGGRGGPGGAPPNPFGGFGGNDFI